MVNSASSAARGEDAPHGRRDLAEGFGTDASRYDRSRPRYPAALAQAVLAGLPGRDLVDVGIGTGISSLPFRAAGCTVLGVEVDPRMAEVAKDRGFGVEVAKFEDWNPAGRTFDAVIAGQAWHWVDPVAGAAKAAQVLRPGGRLAVFWNAGDPPNELAHAFAEVYRTVDTGLPYTPWTTSAVDHYSAFTARAADGMRQAHAFSEPEQWRFDWQATITRDAWLEQVPTAGGHNRIPRDTLSALLDGMGKAIDAAGGAFLMRYATIAVTAVRRQDQ
jgi:SAM-dependent methyltransferase